MIEPTVLREPHRGEEPPSERRRKHEHPGALTQWLRKIAARFDRGVHQARAQADEQLRAARRDADEALAQVDLPPHLRVALLQARAREDGARALERALSDATLADARSEAERALEEQLRHEREATGRQLAEGRAQAEDLVRRRDEVLAMVSHDLRTVLNAISLATQVIRRNADKELSPAGVRMAVGSIQDAAGRMNRLIGDLMDVASLDSGKLRVELREEDVTALVAGVGDAFQAVASAAGVTLESAVPPRPLRARIDADRLTQVLGNLVANALKFTPREGRVLVGVEADGPELRLFVSDTGCGIALRDQQAVFERFHQVSPNDRRGLGLGLYIARSIIQAHGGRMWLESTPGDGSTFFFTVPASDGGLG